MDEDGLVDLELLSQDSPSEGSETNATTEGFEVLSTESNENNYQKVKSILDKASKIIKSKDNQIDNLITALNKSPDLKKILENSPRDLSDTEKITSDQLQVTTALLDSAILLVKSLEAQNHEFKDRLEELSNIKDELNQAKVLLEMSEEKVENLEIEKQEAEELLAAKDEVIKNYESRIKRFKIDPEDQDKVEHPTKEVVRIAGFPPKVFEVENNVAGPGWKIIRRFTNKTGTLKLEFDVCEDFLADLTNEKRHQLYVYLVDKDENTSYALYDNFALHPWSEIIHNWLIKSMDLLETSMNLYGNFEGKTLQSLDQSFIHDCKLYQLMIKEKQK
ncbi:angiopoietin-2-like [Drosophila willistoni]|uniref:angiopoietin-2-like n=1 Tax=Drosophila willistoni TaxID=7260 RepID=UPI000C26D9DC|nr:angiopoietin-2-like [Drosophila willistoni]XP_046865570.1 angiopoietin-2-like [Drosophila willistoni]